VVRSILKRDLGKSSSRTLSRWKIKKRTLTQRWEDLSGNERRGGGGRDSRLSLNGEFENVQMNEGEGSVE